MVPDHDLTEFYVWYRIFYGIEVGRSNAYAVLSATQLAKEWGVVLTPT